MPDPNPQQTPDTNPQETLNLDASEFPLPRVEGAAETPFQLDARAYQLSEELGKGGMGAVYRCGDPALGRDLAIKIMKAEYHGRAEAEQRFLREARVTSSLQHPGIVPVHNLGRLEDGRLHYTMRLVRGQTFAAILKQEAGKPERLPYLLSIFETVCQAVAYAHSKRVIHRDLKPSNVMVGRFGEVQVMDWGLAKVLGPQGHAAATATPAATSTRLVTEPADTPDDLTRTGSGIGTPAYMPPEQALGEKDLVDERADVFALGSILCEILTGQPAYSGADVHEVYRRARFSDLSEAQQRLQQCGAEAALIELCRACLHPYREHRPRDASVVAQRVGEYQTEVQERLRRAEIERAEAELKAREERKQRRLLVALVGVLLVGAALTTWQAVRATRERDDKEIALGKAKAAAEAERQAREDEAAQRKRAEEQKSRAEDQEHKARESEENKNAVLTFFQDKVLSAGRPQSQNGGLGRGVTLRQAVDKAAKDVAGSFKDRPLVEASIRDTLGTTYWYLGETESAILQHERALALYESRLGPDHPDTLTSRNNLGLAYWSARRNEDAIRLHKQTLQKREAILGPVHPETLASRNNLALVYWSADRIEDAIRLHEQTLKQLEAKLGPDHPDTLTSRNNLAEAYRSAGRTAEAFRLHEQNLKQMEAKLGADHPDTLASRNNLANAYQSSGQPAEAIRLHEQNLKHVETTLGPNHPHTLISMASLGVAYRDDKRLKDAIAVLEKAVERGRKLPGGFPAPIVWIPGALAEIYDRDGQPAKGEAVSREFLEQARRQLGAEDPLTAGQMVVLGTILLHQHKYRDAEPLLRDGLKVREAKQREVWTTFDTQSLLGQALLGQKKYADAEPLLLQGYQGLKQREAKIPPQHKMRLTQALERLVQLYEAMNNKDEAAKWRKQLEEWNASVNKPKPSPR